MINSIMVLEVGDVITVIKQYDCIDNSHQFVVTFKGKYTTGGLYLLVRDLTNGHEVILDNYDEDEDFTVLEKGAYSHTEQKQAERQDGHELFKTQLKF